MSDFSRIQHLIFDLGGVIINIDLNLTFDAFARLTGADTKAMAGDFVSKKVFYRYEIGEFSDAEFRDFLRQEFRLSLSDTQIDRAWNELLLDIPAQRIELLKELSKKYDLYLLSNTNSIHFIEVNNILKRETGISHLNELFKKVYLSYEINLAKPSVDIYHYVLKDQELDPSRSLFIDDSAANLEGARKAGLHTLHVTPEASIIELLKNA